MLDFPIVLTVFRVPLIMDASNSIKEILKDIQVRTREIGSAIVGIVYSVETFKGEKKMESMEKMRKLLGQVFKDQPWGVCCYNSSEPRSILEVKRIITETMGVMTTDGYQLLEDDQIQLEKSFRELVVQLGGRERFLILGNICPSARNFEKARVFKEMTKALFDDHVYKIDNSKEDGKSGAPGNQKKECVQLPKPKAFPYMLILVVFHSMFLKEEDNMAQVKEILNDIKSRLTMSSTRVIGVVCSDEPLAIPEEHTFHILLQKILRQTFSCPTGVCSFVRTNLESVDGLELLMVIRCLRVTLDSALSFKPHIQALVTSCCLQLKNISRFHPFLNPHSTKMLVHALIISRFDFATSSSVAYLLTLLHPTSPSLTLLPD
ncbi:unnamed protein product [Ranitomeya imitator]|uniref:Uncharacterized protein n=1 Tax=Ranitomeya imitator TaxID=111125 RepID=A0ABN9MAS1_9NEOB|nr:unnamed protein product [Ranitomeya imitator]